MSSRMSASPSPRQAMMPVHACELGSLTRQGLPTDRDEGDDEDMRKLETLNANRMNFSVDVQLSSLIYLPRAILKLPKINTNRLET